SSRSGWATTPATAFRPTVPVLQATTRWGCSGAGIWLSSATGSDGARLQVGQGDPQVRVLDAAVDLDDLAGDEAAGVRAQPHGGAGDVLGVAEPAQRRAGLEPGAQL